MSDERVPDSFWSHIKVVFTKNGMTAVVNTPISKYLVSFNKQAKSTYRRTIKIDRAENADTRFFLDGDLDFYMIDRKSDLRSFEVMAVDRNRNEGRFVGSKIPCRGGIEITEATEFVREGETIMRVSAIRESIEFMVWEIVGQANGSVYFRALNSISKTTFRFPFYAYINGSHEIKIYNLDKPYLGVKFRLANQDEE